MRTAHAEDQLAVVRLCAHALELRERALREGDDFRLLSHGRVGLIEDGPPAAQRRSSTRHRPRRRDELEAGRQRREYRHDGY